jgi:ribosomal protein S18 acetylase RimI-like enzyme
MQLGSKFHFDYCTRMYENEITFRRYQESDAALLWEIIGPAIRAGETFALPRDMTPEDATHFWAGGDHQCFVAESGSDAVGSFFIRPNQMGGGSHVANAGYATRPEFLGRGVARAMCVESQRIAAAQGYLMMQFNFVISSNSRAVALWQSCGFDIKGRLPDAFRHPTLGFVDALVMVRRL